MQTSRDEILATRTRLEVGSATHVGRVRSNNEDNYEVVPELKLFVLSDGIGGQANGEVASSIAVKTIVAHCLERSSDRSTGSGDGLNSKISKRTHDLAQAVYLANRTIHGTSVTDPRLHGMGATVVAAWIDRLKLSLVHVGDSRAYLFRGAELESLTSDHTLVAEQVRSGLLTVEQARTNPWRRMLIRALGMHEGVEIDIREQDLNEGDILLLCTDGLTGMVPESEISDVLVRERDPQTAVNYLIDAANKHGGEDNVTVIVVRVGLSS